MKECLLQLVYDEDSKKILEKVLSDILADFVKKDQLKESLRESEERMKSFSTSKVEEGVNLFKKDFNIESLVGISITAKSFFSSLKKFLINLAAAALALAWFIEPIKSLFKYLFKQ